MTRYIDKKYSLDDNGDAYFPVTHIDAILGIDFEDDEDLKTTIVNLQFKNSELESKLNKQEETITDLISRIETLENKEGAK